jgi:hypothetical protein
MNDLEHGRDCYRRRAWRDAYHCLLRADQAVPLDRDDLDRVATAAYLLGHDLEFQQIVERLYRLSVETGDRPRGAGGIFWLCLMWMLGGAHGD